ncbi:MAG: hypothetical protein EAZ16_00800 [Sphingobacteriales bacterium]|nr:MAG: hypothetical protein EAZ16_00800 [Sphingobacteriales bacterium]
MRYTYKTSFLFFVLLVCYAINTSAQQKVSNYNLSNFKYRTTGYRALTFTGDFNSGAGNSKTKDTVKQIFLSNGLSGQARYMQTISTDTKQRFTSIFGFANPYAQRTDKYNASKTASNSSLLNLNWHDFNRLYKKDFFIEYGTNANISGALRSEKTNGVKTKSNTLGYGLEATAGVGKGRLEHVSDAQTALFILQDLKDEGFTGTVSPEMVDKFGRFITNLRNGRVFDLRRRTKFQLKEIDRFLKENKIITATDADEISIINDNLYFSFNNDFSPLPYAIHKGYEGGDAPGANNDPFSIVSYIPIQQAYLQNIFSDLTIFPDYISEFNVHTLQPTNEQTMRLSGQKIYARARGVYANSINTSSNLAIKAIIAQAGFEKHTPLNLHWQQNFSVNINYYIGRNTSKAGLRYFQDRLTDGVANQLMPKSSSVYLNAQYAKRYYPNGRSSIEGVAALYLSKQNFIDGAGGSGKFSAATGAFNTKVLGTYFLNHNTVVRGEANIYYFRSTLKSITSTKDRNIQGGLSISIIHTFF